MISRVSLDQICQAVRRNYETVYAIAIIDASSAPSGKRMRSALAPTGPNLLIQIGAPFPSRLSL